MNNYMNRVWISNKLFSVRLEFVNILVGWETVILNCLHGLVLKKACVNFNNNDNTCFEYSVKCGWHDIHTQTSPQGMSHYRDDNYEYLPMYHTYL